jgi:hypothetical protein
MAVISCLALDFVQEPGEGDAKQARTSTAKRRDASPGTKSLVLIFDHSIVGPYL